VVPIKQHQQVVRRQLDDARARRSGAHYIPEDLRRHAVSPHAPSLIDRAEHRAVRDPGCHRPGVHGSLHPCWNRDGAHVIGLADEIGDDPVLLPLLDRLEVKRQQLGASQPAPDQHRDHWVIT
jgi:hypothetical protein